MDINLRLYPLCVFLFFCLSQAGLASDARLKLNAESRVSYDDNITYAHTDRLSDMISQFKLGLGLKRESARWKSDVMANLFHNIYSHEGEFNHTAFDMQLQATGDVTSRDRIVIHDQFLLAEQPRTFADAFGITNGRYRYNQNQFQISATHALTSAVNLMAHYSQNLKAYDRRDLSDSLEHGVGGSVQYAWNTANVLGLGYDFAARDFNPGRTIQIHTLYGAYRRYLTKQLYLDFKVGQDFIEQKDRRKESQSMGEVKLTNDLDENTKAAFSYKKGVGTYSNSQNVFDSYQLSLSVLRQLTSRIYASVDGFYGEGQYQFSEVHDRLMGVGLGAGYQLSVNSRVGLNYDYTETQSNVQSRGYIKNLVQAGIQVQF